ncbi:uncharacterized protein LOC129224249 [Uloborus diversus]|uniref:uncharacterized protein LOC129224249 n=1 Tax=Uloborus diversus TaxID=327109 RepID=UPI00240A694B|nr:uncharacterized protein LOC129224249 [Uloborus diversus]
MLWLCLVVSLAIFGSVSSAEEVDLDDLKCNLKICGAELLSFESFSFAKLFRKLEVANFCVKNCTPPVVHEFYQGIIFAITKRIPGHCSGTQCVDKNRFVALAQCVHDQLIHLIMCSKRLIDLAHVGLTLHLTDAKRNTTCSIVTETTQCFEETLQYCGEKPFQLTKEIFFDVVRVGINAYCHPAYSKEGLIIKRTTVDPNEPTEVTYPSGFEPEPHPKFVKGYRKGAAGPHSTVSFVCLLGSLIIAFSISRLF